ncbi:hypothetical protein L195_g025266 [Trifolium pratense]|uniref:SAM domain-containing protein n=1 Tax=Trifolium pratense TaxID=57577 RepID=A0A2K3NG07_TRIPR|nr:hypothetical protein L195_g025266 [Trifolium pratense]
MFHTPVLDFAKDESEVDMTALRQMGENDLKELGIPMSLPKFKRCLRSLQISPFLILSQYPVSVEIRLLTGRDYISCGLSCTGPIMPRLSFVLSIILSKSNPGVPVVATGMIKAGPRKKLLLALMPRKRQQ